MELVVLGEDALLCEKELLKSGDLLYLTPRHIHRNDNKLFLSDKDKYVSNKFIQKYQHYEEFILNPNDLLSQLVRWCRENLYYKV